MSTTKPSPPTNATQAANGNAESGTPIRRRRKLSAIMMADVSGFSRMMGADEEGTVNRIRDFHQRVQATVAAFEGRVVNTAGDSLFGEFDSVVNAVRCARRIQEQLVELNDVRPNEAPLNIRIGVHLGDVIVEDYTVYGDGVNIAARLEPIADPGGICISEAVYQQIRNKLDLPVQDLGLKELKNIEHPIRLYKVPPPRPERARPSPPAAAAPAPASFVAAASSPSTTAPATPRSTEQHIEHAVQSWFNDVVQAGRLVPLLVGLALLLSPVILFPSGGVLPAGGAVLISIIIGRVWAVRSGHESYIQIALGFGIVAAGILTNWSSFTNTLFIIAGLIIAGVGFGASRKSS